MPFEVLEIHRISERNGVVCLKVPHIISSLQEHDTAWRVLNTEHDEALKESCYNQTERGKQ
jgi:hypothetical protein